MKHIFKGSVLFIHLLILGGLMGCNSNRDTSKERPKAPVKAESRDEHGHEGENSESVYEEGKGLKLAEETQKSLGLEFAEVTEQAVWPELKLTAQMYRSASEASKTHGRERHGFGYATALVSSEMAAQLIPGQKLSVTTKDQAGVTLEGTVWKLDTTQVNTLGKTEALLELPDPEGRLAVGIFIEVQVPVGNAAQKLMAIPHSAVLETSGGKFVYVRNGEFLLRTEVKTNARDDKHVEVTQGLYEGDSIAVGAVESLHLTELRATKGGGHCH